MTTNRVFKNNMVILEKRYPDLAEKIRTLEDNPSYRLIQTKNGQPNLLVKKGHEFLMLYDNDDPVKYCDDYLKKLNIKYTPIVVFMGIGLGYHLDRYFKLLGEKAGTRKIVVFEKDIFQFALALKVADFSQIMAQQNIHFFVGESEEKIYVKLKTQILSQQDITIALKSLKVIPLPSSLMLNEKYYQKIWEILKKAVRQVMVLTGNDSIDSLVGLENMLLNCKHIFSNPGLNTLFGKFQNRPGVIVAAGPSLNKNMHLLQGLRDNALIISCDASFIPLKEKGIRPHLVTSLERTPGVNLFYENIEDVSGTYSVALPVLMPETLDAFKGKKFIAYRGYSHFDWLETDKGRLVVGISVANLSFQILKSLGCDPIILIGQDLAYAEDGDTHVKGNIMGSRNKDISQKPAVELEGNNGKTVKSEKAWEIMKYTFEEDIAAYNGTCINATQGGAKIHGTEIMPFKEAIKTWCSEKFNPGLILDQVHADFSKHTDTKAEMKYIQKKAKQSRKILVDYIAQFKEALDMTIKTEKDIIAPFLKENSSSADMEKLSFIEQKFLELSSLLSKDRKVWDLMQHTLNAYDVNFSNELGFLKDIYTDETCLAMARVKKIRDWFSITGQFLVMTSCLLEETETTLDKNLR